MTLNHFMAVLNSRKAHGAAFLVGCGLTLLGGGFVTSGIFLAIFTATKWLRLVSRARNVIARDSALKGLDMEMDGLRYLGSESSVYATRRLDNPYKEGPLEFEQLCRTNRGSWFKFYFSTMNGSGRAQHLEITPIADKDAQQWLERDHIHLMHEQGRLELA